MSLLSIDCGIKNLALCVIDSSKKIHKWEVAGIPTNHSDGLYPCFAKHLDARPWVLDGVETVLIERQPKTGMKHVENFLHAYFVIHGKKVLVWDARLKVTDCVGSGREMYLKRKKAAVDRTRLFINEGENKSWIPFFNSHKKKDDLADTVMQALSYFEREPEMAKAADKQCKPRKPTENQTRTKYSKANLAYIVKAGGKQDARFKKDLARYYMDLSELKKEFNLLDKL